MKTLMLFTLLFALILSPAFAGHETRSHPENDLLARPAVTVTVGRSDADIVGSDNRALQAAVDYVGNLGGGVVQIGPGEYVMHDSVHMRSRVTLRGAGHATVLKKAASVRSLLAADGDYGEDAVTLADAKGFEIGHGIHVASKRAGGFHTICATILNKDGNYLTLSRSLNADCMMADEAYAAAVFPVISAYEVTNCRIENLDIDGNRGKNEFINGCRGAGIFCYRADGAVFENCIVREYNGDGISFQQSNDVQVLKCVCERNAGKGLHPGSGSQRPVIRECRSAYNDDDGFFFCWRVRNGLVENNEFIENGAYGVSIGHKDSDNLVQKNHIARNKKGGVLWRDEKEPMAGHNIRFLDNTVEDNQGCGLFVSGQTNGTIIRGNVIRDTGKGAQKTGIRIGPDAGDVTIEDNTITAGEQLVHDRN